MESRTCYAPQTLMDVPIEPGRHRYHDVVVETFGTRPIVRKLGALLSHLSRSTNSKKCVSSVGIPVAERRPRVIVPRNSLAIYPMSMTCAPGATRDVARQRRCSNSESPGPTNASRGHRSAIRISARSPIERVISSARRGSALRRDPTAAAISGERLEARKKPPFLMSSMSSVSCDGKFHEIKTVSGSHSRYRQIRACQRQSHD